MDNGMLSSKAFGYVRVSMEKENPENQRQAILDFAARNGIEVIKIFEDIGVSGSEPAMKRPGFVDLYNAARLTGIKTVIVYDLTRLGRDLLDVISTYKLLLDEGFRVLFVKNPELNAVDGNSPLGEALRRVLLAVLAAVGELERAMISERTKTALERARKQGKKLGRPEIPIPVNDIKRLLRRGYSIKEIHEMLLREGKICIKLKDGRLDCLSYDTLRKKIKQLKLQGVI